MKSLIQVIFLYSTSLLLWADNIDTAYVIHVGLTDSRPWSYENENGQLEGIYPELFESIRTLSTVDIEFNLKLAPLKRILLEIESNQSPLALTTMSHKPKRAELMEPLTPIYRTPFVLVSLASKPIKTIEDIKNKDVAMLLGGSGCPCLEDSLPYQKVKLYHHEMGLRMLAKGRVDAVAGPSIRLLELSNKLDLSASLAEPIAYEWRTVWLWASRLNKLPKEYLREIEHNLRLLIENRQFNHLVSKYLQSSQTKFLYSVDQ